MVLDGYYKLRLVLVFVNLVLQSVLRGPSTHFTTNLTMIKKIGTSKSEVFKIKMIYSTHPGSVSHK